MKYGKRSKRSKNVIDLREGSCNFPDSPQAEAACLERRIAHRAQVMASPRRKRGAGTTSRKK